MVWLLGVDSIFFSKKTHLICLLQYKGPLTSSCGALASHPTTPAGVRTTLLPQNNPQICLPARPPSLLASPCHMKLYMELGIKAPLMRVVRCAVGGHSACTDFTSSTAYSTTAVCALLPLQIEHARYCLSRKKYKPTTAGAIMTSVIAFARLVDISPRSPCQWPLWLCKFCSAGKTSHPALGRWP